MAKHSGAVAVFNCGTDAELLPGCPQVFSHLAQWPRKFSAVRGTVSQKISILMSPSEVSRVTDIVLASEPELRVLQ